jgi:hypothetical protein
MEMLTIEQEIEHLFDFLSHPCGFEIGLYSLLTIRPVCEGSPPTLWEISWTDIEEELELEYFKTFYDLREAVVFFVEKRRYKCIGADFEKIRNENHEEH